MTQLMLFSFNKQLPPAHTGKDLAVLVKDTIKPYATAVDFKIANDLANFKSIDQLMSVADDLTKMDQTAYSIMTRTARSVVDLTNKIRLDNERGFADLCPMENFAQIEAPELYVCTDASNPSSPVYSLDHYVQNWKWEESIIPSRTPITEMTSRLLAEVNRAEDDLRVSTASFTDTSNKLVGLRRRGEGNLLVRNLDEIGSRMSLVDNYSAYVAAKATKNPIYVDTRNITTKLVIVKKSQADNFLKHYMDNEYIVPDSAQKLEEDSEYICYAISFLRPMKDDIYHIQKKFDCHIREFNYNPNMRETLQKEAKSTVEAYLNECNTYARLLESVYSHIATIWLQIKAVRTFVESTLLYGIPPKFQSFILKASPKHVQKIHHALNGVFGDGSSLNEEDEDEVTKTGEEQGYYPYVFFPINLHGLLPQR